MNNKEEKPNEIRGGLPTSKQNHEQKANTGKGKSGSTAKGVEDPLKEHSESKISKVDDPKPIKITAEAESEGDYNYKSPGFIRKEKGDIRKTEPNGLKETKDDHQVIY